MFKFWNGGSKKTVCHVDVLQQRTEKPASRYRMRNAGSQRRDDPSSNGIGRFAHVTCPATPTWPGAGTFLAAHTATSVLINSDILIANYDIKQNQFIKSTLCISTLVILKNLMRPLTARLEDSYCSITVANH